MNHFNINNAKNLFDICKNKSNSGYIEIKMDKQILFFYYIEKIAGLKIVDENHMILDTVSYRSLEKTVVGSQYIYHIHESRVNLCTLIDNKFLYPVESITLVDHNNPRLFVHEFENYEIIFIASAGKPVSYFIIPKNK